MYSFYNEKDNTYYNKLTKTFKKLDTNVALYKTISSIKSILPHIVNRTTVNYIETNKLSYNIETINKVKPLVIQNIKIREIHFIEGGTIDV